jgi:antitoxin component of RelBE/YafQ-DinJ toxin-antitoxin module
MPKDKIQQTIEKIKNCARSVFEELGLGWSEAVSDKI